ncbi:MAG TPA: DUF3237 domain-containing protein [Xanthobacteraceae bacterium]|nr:DUF3237 domain-containing protein [Xanthobacteraceae bacterium]
MTLAQQLPPAMHSIGLKPLLVFQLAVNPASVIGKTPGWDRRIGEITGGTFEGERLRGKILSGGSDWQSLRADGVLSLNVRCIMQTDDGALIGLTYQGLRHGPPEVMDKIAKGETVSPADYYLRIQPWFETASEKYAFLNRLLTVGIGHRLAAGPIYNVFEVI